MNKKVILIGGFHETIELCELCGFEIAGIIDSNLTGTYYGYTILGNDKSASSLFNEYKNIPVIVTPDKPEVRKKIVQYYSEIGFSFYNLISPKAELSKSCILGNGIIIQSGVNISANAKIGDFAKLNTNSNIMHDAEIGEYSTIAPNAVILGRVKVNNGCYIGANATILPEKTIGENTIIGAGSVVTKDIKDNVKAAGNPARILND